MKIICSTFLMLMLLTQAGCTKLVDIPPPVNSITDEAVYSTDFTAVSILTGLYTSMSKPVIGSWNGVSSIHMVAGLSADELYLSAAASGTTDGLFFRNTLITAINTGGRSWSLLYNYIYRCNAAIEGLTASQTLSKSVKQQLLGEARFLRAWYYFYLVNLFGPVPLVNSTDYKKNALLSRSPEDVIYQFMVEDLQQARDLLSEQFLNGTVNAATEERVRPTKWAATALLARVYLYKKEYGKAIAEAGKVIDQATLFRLAPLNSLFLKNSTEAIWQLQPTTPFWNTEDAKVFIIPSAGFSSTVNPYYLNPGLLNSVEPGDKRFAYGNWVDTTILNGAPYFYAYKYKVNANNPNITPVNGVQFMTEYQMMLRLGELYLIRAEARAELGEMANAISDLDSLRNRAGLPLLSATDPAIGKQALLDTIMHERRVELFTEGGHRWFDLKRTGRVNAVMSIETIAKGGNWESREAFYPIPAPELQKAPNLEQTPGYPDF